MLIPTTTPFLLVINACWLNGLLAFVDAAVLGKSDLKSTLRVVLNLNINDEELVKQFAMETRLEYVRKLTNMEGFYLFTSYKLIVDNLPNSIILQPTANNSSESYNSTEKSENTSEGISPIVVKILWKSVQHDEKRVHRIGAPGDEDNYDTEEDEAEPDVSNRTKRGIWFNDPYFTRQWYLTGHTTSLNIMSAWESGYTGKGVVVSVVDDGLEKSHRDIAGNFDERASLDLQSGRSNDNDPSPRVGMSHGTRCASLIASVADNNNCIAGVAYNAHIGGIRLIDGPTSDSDEAEAFLYNRDYIDIYSSSWGPVDDGEVFKGPGTLLTAAFRNGALYGRNGRGNIYVWATGNGNNFGDSCAFDGYISNIHTIGVSAVDYSHMKPSYTESCAAILVTAYSYTRGTNNPKIMTADSSGHCSDKHSGTSASTAIVAGVVALMLEANHQLTWRDVQHILIQTSNPQPLMINDGWRKNGVGRFVSDSFGYGLVDAHAATQVAKNWKNVDRALYCIMPFNVDRTARSLNIFTHLQLRLNTRRHYPGCPVRFVEHVQVIVEADYIDRRGSMEIEVKSPMGTRSIMMPARPLDSYRGDITEESRKWPFTSRQQWGETALGDWTLTVKNRGLNGSHLFHYTTGIWYEN